jgi:hypothetical protein
VPEREAEYWYGMEIEHWGSTKMYGPYTYDLMGQKMTSLEQAEMAAITYALTYEKNQGREAKPLFGVTYVAENPYAGAEPLFGMEWNGGEYLWTYPGLDE